MNNSRLDILKNSILATSGLILFGFGVYVIIQANIGVDPWSAFNLGLSKQFGILYGTASIMVSFTVIAVDLILKEKIGIGTILDAIVVGKTVDFLNWIDLIPAQDNLISGILMLVAGFFVAGISQYIYMKAALSCGPRDALQVGIGRRLNKIPIGGINAIMQATVAVIGWILGGPIGIGTILSPFAAGGMQQLAFNMVKFQPKDVEHQNLFESVAVLIGKKPKAD